MSKLLYLVLIITALDLCCTRPTQNKGNSKKTTSACLPGQKTPEFKFITLYDNVTMTCPFRQSVTFLINCKPIAATQIASKKYTISGNSLTLTRYVMKDNGKYSCKGTDANGTTSEKTWILHVKRKSSTTVRNKEKPVNSAVMIDCRHFAGKRVFYSHNNRVRGKTELTNNFRMYSANGLHELFALKIDDTGYYYCGADEDSSKLAVKLVVRELPKVSGKSFVKVGDNVLLKCEYKGPQRIAWYKDDKKIYVQSKAKTMLINKSQEKQHLNLSLKNVTSNLNGRYGCGVVFDNSTFFTTVKLHVFEFNNRFGAYGNRKLNSSLFMFCGTNLRGNVTYSLLKKPLTDVGKDSYKKVQTLKSTQFGERQGIQEFGGGIYIFSSLRLTDEGFYKCRASFNGVTIEKDQKSIWFSPTAAPTSPAAPSPI